MILDISSLKYYRDSVGASRALQASARHGVRQVLRSLVALQLRVQREKMRKY